jgi:hypothetical protein
MSGLKNARERERKSLAELREQLEWLRARHDGGAISAAILTVVGNIEIELAWREHAQ